MLSGEWTINDAGLLVLSDERTQLVAEINLQEDGPLHFVLAGSPEEDPGLVFSKE